MCLSSSFLRSFWPLYSGSFLSNLGYEIDWGILLHGLWGLSVSCGVVQKQGWQVWQVCVSRWWMKIDNTLKQQQITHMLNYQWMCDVVVVMVMVMAHRVLFKGLWVGGQITSLTHGGKALPVRWGLVHTQWANTHDMFCYKYPGQVSMPEAVHKKIKHTELTQEEGCIKHLSLFEMPDSPSGMSPFTINMRWSEAKIMVRRPTCTQLRSSCGRCSHASNTHTPSCILTTISATRLQLSMFYTICEK